MRTTGTVIEALAGDSLTGDQLDNVRRIYEGDCREAEGFDDEVESIADLVNALPESLISATEPCVSCTYGEELTGNGLEALDCDDHVVFFRDGLNLGAIHCGRGKGPTAAWFPA